MSDDVSFSSMNSGNPTTRKTVKKMKNPLLNPKLPSWDEYEFENENDSSTTGLTTDATPRTHTPYYKLQSLHEEYTNYRQVLKYEEKERRRKRKKKQQEIIQLDTKGPSPHPHPRSFYPDTIDDDTAMTSRRSSIPYSTLGHRQNKENVGNVTGEMGINDERPTASSVEHWVNQYHQLMEKYQAQAQQLLETQQRERNIDIDYQVSFEWFKTKLMQCRERMFPSKEPMVINRTFDQLAQELGWQEHSPSTFPIASSDPTSSLRERIQTFEIYLASLMHWIFQHDLALKQKFNEQLDAEKNHHQEQMQQHLHDSEQQYLKSMMEQTAKMEEKHQHTVQMWEKQVETLHRVNQNLTADKVQVQEELQKLKANWTSENEQSESNHRQAQETLVEQWQMKQAKLEQQHRMAIEQVKLHREELIQVTQDHERRQEQERQHHHQELEIQMAKVHSEHELQIFQLRQHQEKTLIQIRNRMKALSSDHQRYVDKLQQNHKEQIKQFTDEFEARGKHQKLEHTKAQMKLKEMHQFEMIQLQTNVQQWSMAEKSCGVQVDPQKIKIGPGGSNTHKPKMNGSKFGDSSSKSHSQHHQDDEQPRREIPKPVMVVRTDLDQEEVRPPFDHFEALELDEELENFENDSAISYSDQLNQYLSKAS